MSAELKSRYLSIEQVCELIPGITRGQLAQWRYLGTGPSYRKLGKKIIYVESELVAFIEGTARTGTADAV
ncbi:AlpA family transcriptional regulator [Homoserinimonas sp. OAct 916]|uniref:helix-turn-helix transcriptional regulator n=1 Tax=Homoserinimonas sp. OAct 916 TaxID=2211450 RepID=UPI000DBE0731|nr:helix-turn-helix domain-containing protein [Homoserinimonas sp. OAct 916]